jgi:chromosome segregation ATPase
MKDFKDQLHQRICQAVVDGKFADRQELVQWLESNEIKVTRQVKNSISIENPYEGAKRPIRLEGEVYEQGFRATGEYRQEVQQRIAEYRGTTSNGIEQTSQTIKDSLNTRANITATAIQQSDEKLAEHTKQLTAVEKQLNQYQALLQSKLSRLKQMNEQIQTKNSKFRTKAY